MPGDVGSRFADNQGLGDLTIARGQLTQPDWKINAERDLIGHRCAAVVDKRHLPFLSGVFDPLPGEALLEPGVVGRDIANIQSRTDRASAAGLRRGEPGQRCREVRAGSSAIGQPGEREAGAGYSMLNGLLATVTAETPEGEGDVALDGRE
jgi:hypothetical protein